MVNILNFTCLEPPLQSQSICFQRSSVPERQLQSLAHLCHQYEMQISGCHILRMILSNNSSTYNAVTNKDNEIKKINLKREEVLIAKYFLERLIWIKTVLQTPGTLEKQVVGKIDVPHIRACLLQVTILLS